MNIPASEKVQNKVLNQLRKTRQPVILYLMNGFQMRGSIKAFDEFAVIVRINDKDQMVYKHAISTIDPQCSLDLMTEES